MKPARLPSAVPAALLLSLGLGGFVLLASSRPAPAHHTNVVQYVLQRVGEAKAGPFDVVLTSTAPKAPGGKTLAPAEEHKLVGDATHRFQAEILSTSAVPPLRVRLRFSQDGWSRTFSLERQPGRDPVFAANVELGPKGKYDIEALVEESGSPGRGWRASFTFDFSYEKLKEVMQALRRGMDRLGRETLTLGLDGEIIPPTQEARIRKMAARFSELAPWTAVLRQGEGQEVYEAEAQKLVAAAKAAEEAAARADYAALATRLAELRAACESCHRVFQQAAAAGKMPNLPKNRP